MDIDWKHAINDYTDERDDFRKMYLPSSISYSDLEKLVNDIINENKI